MANGPDNARLGEHPKPGCDGSTQALLGALIREYSGWSVHERAGALTLELPLPEQGGAVEVGLREPIGVGRIAAGRARWRDAAGELHPLAAAELVARLVAEPSVARAIGLDGPDSAAADRFVARVRASVDNLEQVLHARAADIERLLSEPLGFIEAEQGLLLGHSVHPAPRLRERLGDHQRSIPELRGAVQLELWAVARDRLYVGGLDGTACLDALIDSDPAWLERARELDGELVLLPLHPLQVRALLDEPAAQTGVYRLGPAGREWAPTSSLRTLHADGSPYMIKSSLPLRLTN